jgi:hypothetical protein
MPSLRFAHSRDKLLMIDSQFTNKIKFGERELTYIGKYYQILQRKDDKKMKRSSFV